MSLFALLLCACAEQRVYIESINNPEHLTGKTYCILSGDKSVPDYDLHFQRFSRYLETALLWQGFRRVQDPTTADMAVFFTYGVGEPNSETLSYRVLDTDLLGNLIGSHLESHTKVTSYSQYLNLVAFDLRAQREQHETVELWKSEVESRGGDTDLYDIVPVLIAASADSYGGDEAKTINADDPIYLRKARDIEDAVATREDALRKNRK